MEDIARSRFNQCYSEERYHQFLDDVAAQYDYRPPFRIAETPVFVDRDMKAKLYEACEALTDVIVTPDFKHKTQGAILPEYEMPSDNPHSLFIQLDFGICQEDGAFVPKLIEAQGFPTLYYYQDMIARLYREHFDVSDGYSHLADGVSAEEYYRILKSVILNGHDPKHVVLLEVTPAYQPTRIDFLSTVHALGIKELCLSDLRRDGRTLYYIEDGKRIEVHRIYNRVIFDELLGRPDVVREFSFKDEVDVEWAGHPHWFFRISKYALPFFDHTSVPSTRFVHEIDRLPDDLENYVLKPLFSFSGEGVIFDVRPEHFDAIQHPEHFILQEKVQYAPVIKAPDGLVKCEVRMLLIWEPGTSRPRIVNNLARLSRGRMIGVKYNKDKTWVGGSVAFMEAG